jgi:hypothetical protein
MQVSKFFTQLHLGLFGLQGGHKSQKSVPEPQAQQIRIAFFHHALLGKLIEPLNIPPKSPKRQGQTTKPPAGARSVEIPVGFQFHNITP